MKKTVLTYNEIEASSRHSFLNDFSLKKKLLLWIMPIIILGLLSLSFVAYSSIKIVIETELSSSMLSSVGKSAESINRWLATIMIEPETIASTPAAKRINEDFHNFDRQNLNRHITLHRQHPDIFQDIYAANRQGEYHTIIKDEKGYSVFVGDIENRPYFRSIMAGGPTQITPPLISRTTGIPMIFIVAPILDGKEKPQGLIGAGISLKYIQQIAQGLQAGETGYGFIIAQDGTYIYHPDDEFIMQKKITELENPSIKALGKSIAAGGSGMYRYYRNREPMVAFYHPIPISGWVVATVLPEKELFAPAIQAVKLLISITIIFAGLIAIAIIYAMQRLTRPLQTLADRIGQIAAGNFKGGHLKIESNDEIGSLSKSFNEMLDGLENQRSEVKTLVNKLQRTVKDLQKAKTYTAGIIDSMPSILIGVDKNGSVTQWNNKAENATGIPIGQAMGKPLNAVYPRIKSQIDNLHRTIQNREIIADMKIPFKKGAYVAYENITIFPLNAPEEPVGAVIRIDDVTQQVRMEEMMIQSEKILSVGGLAAGMAHEINNPLAGMIQSANVMKSRLENIDMPANLNAAKELGISMEDIATFMKKRNIFRMLDAIQKSGSRAAEIVSTMLTFARKSDAAMSLHSPDQLMDKILDLAATDYDLKKQYDFKSIQIIKEYDDNLPMLRCEGSKIQQVFLNILRNGAQAMQTAQTKSPQFIIRIYTEKEPAMISMEIEDNGPGMDRAIRSKVFDPFFTTKPVGIGTGLGLSVSYFIITENHKGTMDVISEPGKGSNFIIRLPVGTKK